jgi:hypothetical protein
MVRPGHRRAHARWLCCVAITLAVPAHAEGPGRTEGAQKRPPPEADDGSDLQVYGNPLLQDFGYYEVQFRVDQLARIAVRCLGVEGAPSVTVRFRIEVDNMSEQDVQVDTHEMFLRWSRRARSPDQDAIRPRRVEGPRSIERGDTGKVIVHFEPRGHLRPEEIHHLQLQWTLRSGYGSRPIHQSTFVREVRGDHVRYAFVPYMTHPLGPRHRRPPGHLR